MRRAFAVAAFVALCNAQQACEKDAQYCKKAEEPLAFNVYKCTKSGGCAKDGENFLTMDANWRWTQKMGTWQNCWQDGWSASECSGSSNQENCATSCMLEGVEYSKYGVRVSEGGDKVEMDFMGETNNVGARLYVIEKTGKGSEVGEQWQYKPFDLRNKEMTFTVDISQIGCGINAPAYLVEMPLNGGYDGSQNTAGALYGTGYCDAQCPGDVKWVNGKANIPIMERKPPFNTESAYKACCAEMDLFEGNTISNALTPHPVAFASNGSIIQGLYECTDDRAECRKNSDTAGCDWATYRLQYYNGGKNSGASHVNFYGKGMTVDVTQPMEIVTQFITNDGTDTGDLSEIRRYYVQNGKVIDHMKTELDGKEYDSLTDEFCEAAEKILDNGDDHFTRRQGMKGMGDSFTRGMTLVLSLWDDAEVLMRWLDGKYPPTAADSAPGAMRGTCGAKEGPPTEPESNFKDQTVWFSNLKYGEIGSTFDSSAAQAASTPTPPVSTPTPPARTPTPPARTPTPPVSTPTPPQPVSTPTPQAAAAPTPAPGSCLGDKCSSQSACCGSTVCKKPSFLPFGLCMKASACPTCTQM